MTIKALNVTEGLLVMALTFAAPLAAIPGDVDPLPAVKVLIHKMIALFA